LVLAVFIALGVCVTAHAADLPNGTVYASAIQADGKVIIVGDFTSYDDNLRSGIARFNADGALDLDFNPGVDMIYNPGTHTNGIIYAIAIQSDGKFVIGGSFSFYRDGKAINRIARLNTDGSLDDSFDSGIGADWDVRAIAIQPNGKIIIGGYFSAYNGNTSQRIARIESNGMLDISFAGYGISMYSAVVSSIAIQPDGKIIIGGIFNIYRSELGANISNIARLFPDGTLDVYFSLSAGSQSALLGIGSNTVKYINALALRSDGNIILGGGYPSYPFARANMLRSDGTADPAFTPDTGPDPAKAIAIQSDGKIIIGGSFTSYNGATSNHIVRLNPDGSTDYDFNPGTGANGDIETINLQSDGKIIIGGNFTEYNGTNINGYAQLDTAGTLDMPSDYFPLLKNNSQPWSCSSIDENDLSASKENLVVITHGWNGSANDYWVTKMRDDINGYINYDNNRRIIDGNIDTAKTAIRLFDWHEEAATGPVLAVQAYENARAKGDCLADQIIALKTTPDNIHLIAHSAGANVIQTAVDRLAEYYYENHNIPTVKVPTIQLTFLDAYVPWDWEVSRFGDMTYGHIGNSQYQLKGFVDNYYDTRPVGPVGEFDGTRREFTNGTMNIDVTGLDTSFSETSDDNQNWNRHHTWPINVYDYTIIDPSYPVGVYPSIGFIHAKENIRNATSTQQKKKFVYVALGDSYQSGEGAGNSISDSADYLTNAYENGLNYPNAIDGETNTYNKILRGDGCHRSLVNYAKIYRDKLKPDIPDKDIILIDVTCSGATIEPEADGYHTVVGKSGYLYSTSSQIAIAKAKLLSLGLTAYDVDLVSVGMGGNDAKFGEIIQACVIPNLARFFLDHYIHGLIEIPFGFSERAEILNQVGFGTCEKAVENHFVDINSSIADLLEKESWAQFKLLETFGKARILQFNYPSILPKLTNSAPAWCGGIRKEDLEYANRMVRQINSIISESVSSNAANDPRIEMIDVAGAFGNDALCTGNFANGLSEENFNAEAVRLINEPEVHTQLNIILLDYRDLRFCKAKKVLNFSCDEDFLKAKVMADSKVLGTYLSTASTQQTIFANLAVKPLPGGESEAIRYDRSRGLFHPNANGFSIMACYLYKVFNHQPTDGCASPTNPPFDFVNGNIVGNAPINSVPGELTHIQMSGYAPSTPIQLTFYSMSIDLGMVMSDDAGNIDVTVALPQAGAGVHTLELAGDTPGGVGMHKRVFVSYPGRPVANDTYGIYLCGFTPASENNEQSEQVDIVYLQGKVFETLTPNEDGCVLAELPVFDIPGTVEITARSQMTGKETETTIDPILSDITAPTTTPAITGNKGQNGWYVSTTSVSLDAKDNKGGVGVEKTLYALDSSAFQIYSSTTPIQINSDGIHSLQFYSIDYFGNQEATNTIEVNIDKTAPEAKIAVNAYYADLEITGSDNLSAAKVTQNSDKVYTITDEAGNFIRLNFDKVKERKRLVQAKLNSLEYSSGRRYILPRTNMVYTWDPFKNIIGKQAIEVRKDFFVYADYDRKADLTTIMYIDWKNKMQKVNYNGVKIVRLITSKGILDFQY
jgi:uncharacterized delta-60 repeat protein